MPDAPDTALAACEATSEDPTSWELHAGEWPPHHRVRKDWEPLRQLAQKRARITLQTVWEDPAQGARIHRVQYRRFCYKDYSKHKTSLAVVEKPCSIALKADQLEDGAKKVVSHYIVSFRGGRVALYSRRAGKRATVRRTWPDRINLGPCITNMDLSYPEVQRRFSRRLVKLLRAKARANGVRLPKGDDLKTVLTAALWPALAAVKAHHKTVRNKEWTPCIGNETDRWLVRFLRCPPDSIVKSMTGYDSRVVKRLFWEAMKPVVCEPLPGDVTWKNKWAWCALLRTWLTVDHTQALLRAPKIAAWDDSFTKDPAKVRRLLKQWEPKQVLRALTDTCADSFTIRDTLRMLEGRARLYRYNAGGAEVDNPPALPEIPRTRGPQELHEWLSAEVRRVNREQREARERARIAAMTPEQRAAMEERERKEREPFEHSEELRAVDGRQVVVDGVTYTIILPLDGPTLAEWGQTLHNCIGSYAWHIREGRCQILGVRTEGEAGKGRPVHYGIELRDDTIVQFRGVCNEDAPWDLQMAVDQALVDAKLVTPKPSIAEIAATTEVARYGREDERAVQEP